MLRRMSGWVCFRLSFDCEILGENPSKMAKMQNGRSGDERPARAPVPRDRYVVPAFEENSR